MAAALLFGVLLLGSCGTPGEAPGPRVVHPGAPGEGSREPAPEGASGPVHTAADVRFMHQMIVHHEQALAMSALAPERTDRDDILLLARRIERGQGEEIAQMKRWLEARGEAVPEARPEGVSGAASGAAPHEDHAESDSGRPSGMPGMLGESELRTLAEARDDEFDRLFLELMIHHHEGALTMVERLLASPGAGQDAELFQFAAHVDGDQRIEIRRMRRMLEG